MFIFLADDLSTATVVLLTIAIVIALLGLGFLLFRSIMTTFLKEREEKQFRLDGVLTKGEMNSLVATYINRTNGETPFSLIYVDLDKLDDFEYAFGQKETNAIIKRVAAIIKQSLPAKTYLSRYRGDEFMIFLPNEYNRLEVTEIAADILDSFRQKFTVHEEIEIDLTASIAVAQFPNHGENLTNLLQSLQLSVHHIKKEGGNNLKVYTQALESEEEEMNYYYQIKRAISERQFKMYYQPIVDTKNDSIYAYEGLLRWNHPELGILAPNKFINIMEQTGDIHWVGQWGLETIIKQHNNLKLIGLRPPLLALNLSPRQLMNPNIAEEFAKILKTNKANASDFILEISEFLIFEKQQIILDNLVKLKKLNFKLAIDEFGIDIASFEQIEEMGIDIFKIDYKFVSDDSYSVNKYMEFFMDFAKQNDKVVICQSVEDEEGEARVKEFGIHINQGYHYSEAIDGDQIPSFKLGQTAEEREKLAKQENVTEVLKETFKVDEEEKPIAEETTEDLPTEEVETEVIVEPKEEEKTDDSIEEKE